MGSISGLKPCPFCGKIPATERTGADDDGICNYRKRKDGDGNG